MNAKSIASVLALLSALLLVGCSHEGADWKTASTADTSDAYQKFLTQYPKSPNAPQAQARIKQLQDQHDWQVATAADSRDAYEQYLAQHPDSQNAQEARIRLENFAQASVATASAGTAVAAQPGPSRHAKRMRRDHQHGHALRAARGIQQPGARRIALEAAVEQVPARTRIPDAALRGRQGASGWVVRLQLAVESRAQGKALCEKLKAHAQSCVTVSAG